MRMRGSAAGWGLGWGGWIGLALAQGSGAGCAGDKEPTDAAADATDADADADADSDADADADADADSDADTDTGATEPADLANCTAVDTYDQGTNGSIERTTTIGYDALGLESVAGIDDTDPNTPVLVTWVRDAAGNELARQFDDNGDGTLDEVWLATWTPDNQLATFCVDTGYDGQCDYAERLTYDASGVRSMYEQDGDGDGVFESTCTYTHDASDRITGYDCDGPLNRSAVNTYTEVTPYDYVQDVDLARNGSVDQSFEYRYDAAGRVVFQGQDTNANGTNESETTTTYNSDGTVSVVAGELSSPSSTFRYEYTYDPDGYLASVAFGVDVTGDGVPDSVDTDTLTWTCPP